jgi:hypothetical protein
MSYQTYENRFEIGSDDPREGSKSQSITAFSSATAKYSIQTPW